MKKIFTFILGAALFLVATDAFAQVSVGVGYLHSTLTSTYKGKAQDNELSNGMYIGAGFDLSIVEDALKLTPGLYLSVLSNRAAANIGGFVNIQSKFTEVALNLPVYLSYGLELNHAALYVFAGPTFQYGLSSKYKVDGNAALPTGIVATNGVIDNYKDYDYSPFNIYLGGGLGADLNEKLRVTLGFDYGMLNLYKGKEEGTKYNRYNFKIGVGYLF